MGARWASVDGLRLFEDLGGGASIEEEEAEAEVAAEEPLARDDVAAADAVLKAIAKDHKDATDDLADLMSKVAIQ